MNPIDAAYGLVRDYPGGSESLAPRVGKNATTLSHEVSRTGHAKLGLETAVDITMLSGDLRILRAFATTCGQMLLPLPAGTIKHLECVKRLGVVLANAGCVVRETTEGMEDSCITGNERDRIQRACAELISGTSALMAAVNALHAAGQPGGVAR